MTTDIHTKCTENAHFSNGALRCVPCYSPLVYRNVSQILQATLSSTKDANTRMHTVSKTLETKFSDTHVDAQTMHENPKAQKRKRKHILTQYTSQPAAGPCCPYTYRDCGQFIYSIQRPGLTLLPNNGNKLFLFILCYFFMNILFIFQYRRA